MLIVLFSKSHEEVVRKMTNKLDDTHMDLLKKIDDTHMDLLEINITVYRVKLCHNLTR